MSGQEFHIEVLRKGEWVPWRSLIGNSPVHLDSMESAEAYIARYARYFAWEAVTPRITVYEACPTRHEACAPDGTCLGCGREMSAIIRHYRAVSA